MIHNFVAIDELRAKLNNRLVLLQQQKEKLLQMPRKKRRNRSRMSRPEMGDESPFLWLALSFSG
jgi:hypothetical protein